MSRAWDALEHSALMRMSASRSYLQDSGIYAKEGTELLHEPEVVDNLEEKSYTRGLMCIQTHGLWLLPGAQI